MNTFRKKCSHKKGEKEFQQKTGIYEKQSNVCSS